MEGQQQRVKDWVSNAARKRGFEDDAPEGTTEGKRNREQNNEGGNTPRSTSTESDSEESSASTSNWTIATGISRLVRKKNHVKGGNMPMRMVGGGQQPSAHGAAGPRNASTFNLNVFPRARKVIKIKRRKTPTAKHAPFSKTEYKNLVFRAAYHAPDLETALWIIDQKCPSLRTKSAILVLQRKFIRNDGYPPQKLEDFKPALRHVPVAFLTAAMPQDSKVLYMWGKAGIGKTKLAMAHFPNHALVTNKKQLENVELDYDYDGIVFKDFTLKPLKMKAQHFKSLIDPSMNRVCGRVVIQSDRPIVFTSVHSPEELANILSRQKFAEENTPWNGSQARKVAKMREYAEFYEGLFVRFFAVWELGDEPLFNGPRNMETV